VSEQQANGVKEVKPLDLLELLTEPCIYCIELRKVVHEFSQMMTRAPIQATVIMPREADYRQATGQLKTDLVVQCQQCHGTRRTPTKAGNQLVWFLKWFLLDDAKAPSFPPTE